MKKLLYTLCLGMLGTTMALAQPKIKFKQEIRDLGYVLWRHPATIAYTFKNTGDKPLVISKVIPSCGCTIANWTEQPIAPGEEGVITAVFDAQAIGRFDKDLGVFCNAANLPIYLRFTGEVTTSTKEYAADHLHKVGPISIDRDEIAFENVSRGEKPSMELTVVNHSNNVYNPVLMHLPPYLTAVAVPERLARGKMGKIVLTLDSWKLPKLGITTSTVYLSRFMGDKVGSDNEIPVSVVLLPDFSMLTPQQKANPPIIQLSETVVDFTKIPSHKKMTKTVIIENHGKTDLKIQDLQVFTIGLSVNINKRVIRPGKRAKMKVTLLSDNLSRIKGTPRILMITNDLKQPKITIGIKYNAK